MSSRQVIAKNLLISYSGVENAGQQCLLFLHGWRSDKEIWTNIKYQISNIKYKVFALDLPGFGGSQVPSVPMTIGDYADVVAEFIKKLDLKNVVIVAHSFGGRVGIKLAAQNPALISKLILVDSAGFAVGKPKKNLMNMAAKIAKPFFKPKIMQPLRKKIYQGLGAEDYLATPELQKTFVNITNEDLSADMKKIQTPTLIITGENDTDTPLEFGRRMHSLIPDSQLLILKNAGHFSFLDQPESFAAELHKFINQK